MFHCFIPLIIGAILEFQYVSILANWPKPEEALAQ